MDEARREPPASRRPKAIAGIYILNDKDELLLARAPKWKNKYSLIGGHIEFGESAKDAAAREAKEEANLDLKGMRFAFFVDGIGLDSDCAGPGKHFIFLDFIAWAKNPAEIKLGKELSSYKWDSIDNWIKRDKADFAPCIHEYLPQLKKEVAASAQDYEKLYWRALADYQNLKKRCDRERSELVKYGNERLILEILPSYNNLKLALRHARSRNPGDENISQGIEYVIRQFAETLGSYGVEEIQVNGRLFDHAEMDAVDKKATGEKELDGKVAEELKPGYKLNGKVIEHAKVAVWKYDK